MASKSNEESYVASDASHAADEDGASSPPRSPAQADENDSSQPMEELPMGLSAIEIRRAEKIKRNMARFRELGLDQAQANMLEPSTPQLSSSSCLSANNQRKRPNSVPAPTRKSSRIMAQGMSELLEGQQQTSSSLRRSPRIIQRATIVRVARDERNCQARQAVLVGKTKRNILINCFGDKTIHPMKLDIMKKKTSRLLEESHNDFLIACKGFIHHYGQRQCMNYKVKTYKTKCTCLKDLVSARNSERTVTQLSNSLRNYFSMIKLTQYICLKDWIRACTDMKLVKKAKIRDVQKLYPINGVFCDAPASKKPFYVCQNTFMLLYNLGYNKYSSIKKQIYESSLKPHGLTNRESNRFKNTQEKYNDINAGLKLYFDRLKNEHAEPHATRIVRESTGVGLRAEEVDTVELPSAMTSRQLYSKFCFERGWSIQANAKGALPKIKDYPRRPFDDMDWPEGSIAKPVPSRGYFNAYWKKYYPKMRIRPPSEDTCAECWQYKNQLGVLSRRMHNQVRQAVVENDRDMEDALQDEQQGTIAALLVDQNEINNNTNETNDNTNKTNVKRNIDTNNETNDETNVETNDKINEPNNDQNAEGAQAHEEENIDSLLNQNSTVTNYLSNCSPNDVVLEPVSTPVEQEDEVAEHTFMSQLVLEEEQMFTKAGKHVGQAREMRKFCRDKTKIA